MDPSLGPAASLALGAESSLPLAETFSVATSIRRPACDGDRSRGWSCPARDGFGLR
jgi:hypothetical protein